MSSFRLFDVVKFERSNFFLEEWQLNREPTACVDLSSTNDELVNQNEITRAERR